MTRHHNVTNISVSAGRLHMTVDGKRYTVDLAAVSPSLAAAGPEDQRRVEVSASGYGLHWPTVDEDLSVDGLIRWCEANKSPRPRSRALRAGPEWPGGMGRSAAHTAPPLLWRCYANE